MKNRLSVKTHICKASGCTKTTRQKLWHLFSIIAFSERCELKKVTVESSDIHVIKRDYLYATIRNIWDKSEDKVDETKLAVIFEKLKALTNADEATKLAHIENIKEKFKPDCKPNDKVVPVENSNADEPVCPKCGAAVIKRVATKGANAGKEFYGCSNYPKCRGIINIQ